MVEHSCDVAIVGAGPTGLSLALFLAAQGVRTAVIEQEAGTVVQPRAVTLDDESLRAFATVGVLEAIRPLLLYGYGTRFYTGDGRKLAEVSANATRFGYPCRSGFSQPELVSLLARRAKDSAQTTLLFNGLRSARSTAARTCSWRCLARVGSPPFRHGTSSAATVPTPRFAVRSVLRSTVPATRSPG